MNTNSEYLKSAAAFTAQHYFKKKKHNWFWDFINLAIYCHNSSGLEFPFHKKFLLLLFCKIQRIFQCVNKVKVLFAGLSIQ